MSDIHTLTQAVGKLQGTVEQHMDQQGKVNDRLTDLMEKHDKRIDGVNSIAKRAHRRINTRNLVLKVGLGVFIFTVIMLGATGGADIYDFVVRLTHAAEVAGGTP